MTIWQRPFTLALFNQTSKNTLVEHLGIEYVAVDDSSLSATMPVDSRTHQPLGMLHGGASVVLAETLGSLAANFAVSSEYYCVGLDINANHIRAVRSGFVTGKATPLHIGATTQVWQIEIRDERQRLVCTSRLTMAVLKHKKAVNIMIITFSQGKIIATQHEVVIRIDGSCRMMMQAQVDELTLIGGANVITAVGSGLNWSIKLDTDEQLQQLATEIGIAITHY